MVLNAAAALVVAELAQEFGSAIELAERSIKDRRAAACLKKLVEVSKK